MVQDIPSYTAKILKYEKELVFDFSHLAHDESSSSAHSSSTKQFFEDVNYFEQMVNDWCEQHDLVAKNCTSFILRLPNGELKSFFPHANPVDENGNRILQ